MMHYSVPEKASRGCGILENLGFVIRKCLGCYLSSFSIKAQSGEGFHSIQNVTVEIITSMHPTREMVLTCMALQVLHQ